MQYMICMLIYIKYSVPSSTLKLKLGEYVCIRVCVCIYGWVIGSVVHFQTNKNTFMYTNKTRKL